MQLYVEVSPPAGVMNLMYIMLYVTESYNYCLVNIGNISMLYNNTDQHTLCEEAKYSPKVS